MYVRARVMARHGIIYNIGASVWMYSYYLNYLTWHWQLTVKFTTLTTLYFGINKVYINKQEYLRNQRESSGFMATIYNIVWLLCNCIYRKINKWNHVKENFNYFFPQKNKEKDKKSRFFRALHLKWEEVLRFLFRDKISVYANLERMV
jgi:hypothetical protein